MNVRRPKIENDEQAEALLEGDLSEYISAESLSPVPFEIAPKTERVNMRLPKGLLDAVKAEANRQAVPYQRWIRVVLERAVAEKRGRPSTR